MGTHYYLIDEDKNALELGKFYALARVAGVTGKEPVRDLTLDHVAASKRGWLMRWSNHYPDRQDEWKDTAWSAAMAERVEHWMSTVAVGRVRILHEVAPRPWPVDALDYPAADLNGWTLWTPYTHPIHDGAEPPWRLFPEGLDR